ncbi:DUF397 domain-containing protein [Nonomuraea polychroma]|uniref:DUF397 domain-containing protein n=1 Tax=Nonomuraea polychroma TaxID=46176 RepID=UPI003D8D0D29
MLTDRWTKSSLSGSSGGGCVETRLDRGMIQLRDSKQRGAGPVLVFTPGEWRAFLGGVGLGEFDLPEGAGV